MLKLKPFQHIPVAIACRQAEVGGIQLFIADDVGLGKTPETIAALMAVSQRIDPITGAILIVTPPAVAYQWRDELDKFWPNHPPCAVITAQQAAPARQATINALPAKCIIITTYTMLRTLTFPKNIWACVVDEFHNAKNFAAKTTKAIIEKCTAKHRIALTATLIDGKPHEAYPLLSWLDPQRYPFLAKDYHKFRNTYSNFRQFGTGQSMFIGAKNISGFNRIMARYMIRRLKRDVQNDLPPLVEETVWIPPTKAQVNTRKRIEGGLVALDGTPDTMTSAHIQSSDGRVALRTDHVLARAGRHLQVSISPVLIGVEDSECPKIDYVVGEAEKAKRPLIVYSQFRGGLSLARKALSKARKIDTGAALRIAEINGDTPSAERNRIAQGVNSGEVDVCLLSNAGGAGLNLQGADRIICLSVDWSSTINTQLMGRIDRITQENPMRVTYLQSSPVDKEVLQCVRDKAITNKRLLAQRLERTMAQ